MFIRQMCRERERERALLCWNHHFLYFRLKMAIADTLQSKTHLKSCTLKLSHGCSALPFVICMTFLCRPLFASASAYDMFRLHTYDKEQLEAVKRASKIGSLPGQPAGVSLNQYSGYVGVDEAHGRALFYWFIQASSAHPHSRPLVLWLNGGPGCSSIGYGAIQEIGPFRVIKSGSGLTLNKYSWIQEANMLFLDSPVGVGFSFSNTSSDLYNFGDKLTAKEALNFLITWFDIFPEYKKHDFYMAGESYAGHYVPQLASLVHDLNQESKEDPIINLKGFMVGNPSTNDYHDWVGIIDYAWSHAVISDQLHTNTLRICDFTQVNWTSDCLNQVKEVFAEYNKIDVYNLYRPICISNSSTSKMATNSLYSLGLERRGRPLYPSGYDACLDNHTIKYFNKPEVQKALHANASGNIPYPWTVCNNVLLDNWKDSQFSILPIYDKLIKAGLRIWVYSGDVDGRIPVTATRYTLNALGLPIVTPWHSWYYNHQVAGWTQEFEGLVYATIRGAGHLVPQDSPRRALALFSSFLEGRNLPT